MRKEDRFCCTECGYDNFEGGPCQVCGGELEKIKGEEVSAFNRIDDGVAEPEVFEDEKIDLFDPDDISWYEETGYSA